MAAHDQLNGAVQEIKTAMTTIRDQMKDIESEMTAKQKSKDELGEKLTKRDSMVSYYQKNIKSLTEAMVKFEVGFLIRIQSPLKNLNILSLFSA